MNDSINDQLENLFNTDEGTPSTPHGALPLLFMDTVYRLCAAQIKRENRFREQRGEAPLGVGLSTLTDGVKFVLSFDTYFVEAEEDENGQIQWVSGDKLNFPSVYFRQMSDLTYKLVDHAHDIEDVELDTTALDIIRERDRRTPAIPDMSGNPAIIAEFADEIANKVVFYATQVASIVRNAGHRQLFNPRSSFTIDDVERAAELHILDRAEPEDVNYDVDHPGTQHFTLAGALAKPSDEVRLDAVELERADANQKALAGWLAVYDHFIHDEREALRDEVKYMRDITAERVAQMRSEPAVKGVAKPAA